MISWHRVGQPIICIRRKWRYLFLPFLKGNGPEEGEYSMIMAVERLWGRAYFELPGFGNGRFDARGFRPAYPTIIDQLRKLDAPTPERVKEDA